MAADKGAGKSLEGARDLEAHSRHTFSMNASREPTSAESCDMSAALCVGAGGGGGAEEERGCFPQNKYAAAKARQPGDPAHHPGRRQVPQLREIGGQESWACNMGGQEVGRSNQV